MKFGIYVGPSFSGSLSGPQALDTAIALAKTAHESGFDGIFVGHHSVVGTSHMLFPPLIMLARLATDFPNGYLGTAAFVVPLRDPISVAEETATLDVISGGRLIFGVGSGHRRIEFESLGIDMSERVDRLAEGVAILKMLWEHDEATFAGRYFHFTGISINPKPIQKPRPPIWVGADSRRAIERCLDVGDAWMASGRHSKAFLRRMLPVYKRALEDTGKTYDGIPMFRELHLIPEGSRGDERSKRAISFIQRSYSGLSRGAGTFYVDEDELKSQQVLVGKAQEVTDEIGKYREEFDVPFMWFRLYWPGLPLPLALETIQHFGEDVLPLFR